MITYLTHLPNSYEPLFRDPLFRDPQQVGNGQSYIAFHDLPGWMLRSSHLYRDSNEINSNETVFSVKASTSSLKTPMTAGRSFPAFERMLIIQNWLSVCNTTELF